VLAVADESDDLKVGRMLESRNLELLEVFASGLGGVHVELAAFPGGDEL